LTRRLVPLAVAICAAVFAGVGAAVPSRLGVATAQTTAAGTAAFTLSVSGSLGSTSVTTHERGSVSFTKRVAHVYRVVPNVPIPEEQIIVGPWTYSNANVQNALSDPNAKPWVKLDTSKLPKGRRLGELDHVRALAYLAAGAVGAKQIGPSGTLTHFRSRVDPKRVVAGTPAAERTAMAAILRADYSTKPFAAEFWLDGKSRVRRVRVALKTNGGSTITISGTFTGFGSKVDLKLPPAREIVDITPR
jgi:hypothetical protein